jgi:hypothetical protein
MSIGRAIERVPALRQEGYVYTSEIHHRHHSEKGQKLIQINSMPDHTHILIGMKPSIALSDLIRDVKSDSTEFINGKRWIKGRFNWQEGFGAFSYEHSPPDGGLILPSAESIYLSSRVLSTGASSTLSRCGVSATARY